MRSSLNTLALFIAAGISLHACVQTRPASPWRLPAQSEERAQQELSDELTRRWSETKVPDFLENKKSDIAEVIDMGLRMDVTVLNRLLAADSVKPEKKLSELVNPKFYTSLQHQSKLKHLVGNLMIGELMPRSSEVHYSRHGVYLELHLKSDPKPFAWGDVEFHFDYKLLDRTDYHVNPSWSYGNYNPDSASPAVSLGRMQYFLREYLATPGSQNEFVFDGPVEFRYLTRIVVPKGEKPRLIRELTQKKVARPTSASWEQLIVEQVMPPKKADPQEPTGPTD